MKTKTDFSGLTLEKIRSAADLMRKNDIPACVVKTKKEALEMTRNDPGGREWKVGEEYYMA